MSFLSEELGGCATQSADKAFPTRGRQITELTSLLVTNYSDCWPVVFASGPPATGKSSIARYVLKREKVHHVWVNCSECFSARILLETILSEVFLAVNKNNIGEVRCSNTAEFIMQLQDCLATSEKIVLVLDSASYLLRLDSKLFAAICRLHQLGLPVVVLLISHLTWEKFRFVAAGIEPMMVRFPAYTRDELVAVLSHDVPPTSPNKELFTQYLALFCSVFDPVCRDLRQLRRQALLHFGKYLEPVTKGEVGPEDTYRLWRSFETVLKRALQTVYLGEVSSIQWSDHLASENDSSLPVLLSRHHVELPLYSKYLLIAAFLASYNPASSDKRFFVKGSDRNVRKKKITKKGDRTSNLVLGPKAFPLDRLMAIFGTIVDSDVAASVAVSAQISSLVSLGLMLQMNASDRLEAPRYKCLASLDFVRTISRHVRFSLDEFLYDFVVKAS